MRNFVTVLMALFMSVSHAESGQWIQTPYQQQKALYEFYFNEPEHINSALYWLRAQMNPLMDEPYNQSPELMETVVVIHGAEIVTVAHKNYERYKEAVERMRYYADLGVSFKVCGLAADDYNYAVEDFYDFIDVVPSAITELVHWQQQGYALIKPDIKDKIYSIEEIR